MKGFVTAVIVLSCMRASAAVEGREESVPVVVYLRTGGAWVSGPSIRLAQSYASRLFAKEGIRLEWRDGKPPHGAGERPGAEDTVAISVQMSTPVEFEEAGRAKSLAVAYPYGKGPLPITVFGDRVARFLEQFRGDEGGKVLGHILAHEICHVLEGVARHSDEGLMKAHWSLHDLMEMRGAGLPFAPPDQDLLRQRFTPRGISAAPVTPGT